MQTTPRWLAVDLAAERVQHLPTLLNGRWRAAYRHIGNIDGADVRRFKILARPLEDDEEEVIGEAERASELGISITPRRLDRYHHRRRAVQTHAS